MQRHSEIEMIVKLPWNQVKDSMVIWSQSKKKHKLDHDVPDYRQQ